MIIYEKSFWDISFLKTKSWFNNSFSNSRSQKTVEEYYKLKQNRCDFKSHNYKQNYSALTFFVFHKNQIKLMKMHVLGH